MDEGVVVPDVATDVATVDVRRRLAGAEQQQVSALIDAATAADGVRPLNEHVMLHLRHGGDEDTRNLLAREPGGSVVGYAHLDVTDVVAGPSAEIVVHPLHRGQGYGRALVEQALRTAAEQVTGPGNAPGPATTAGPANTPGFANPPSLAVAARPSSAARPALRLWSHGSHRSARELASRMDFSTVRSLWQMRRSLFAPIPDAPVPEGVTIRTFDAGRDSDAWLELNRRAFAEHPEQGSWGAADLAQRLAEGWFDPSGFFLAERGAGTPQARLVGFHWTKVHGGHPRHDHDNLGPHEHSGHGHAPMGEVYVIGVDPDERGTGLGHALTVRGMCHLRALGLGEVMLYVDESNDAAIGLYESLGFIHWDTDVMYARAAATERAPSGSGATREPDLPA